jgi:hypothetical protein
MQDEHGIALRILRALHATKVRVELKAQPGVPGFDVALADEAFVRFRTPNVVRTLLPHAGMFTA